MTLELATKWEQCDITNKRNGVYNQLCCQEAHLIMHSMN